jgi:thymidylate synthase
VVEELLWFLRGSTNAKELDDRGVKIWNGNTTREFLDSRGLQHYEEGDIGPTYGFGFRHYGAEYKGMRADYREKGFDQIAYVLNELKTNPSSRRMLINLWNPAVMDQMSLTPCACQYQFYVNDGVLSCQMYQRSAEMFLGNPFNITSSSLLTNILARYAGLKVGRLIICLGDAHIYEGHIDAVKTQLQRQTRPFPILKIDNNIPENMKELEYKHFKLIGYEPHPSIKATMIA